MPRGRTRKALSNMPAHIDPAKLPDYVGYDHRGRGRWYLSVYDKTAKRITRTIRLGDGSMTMREIWEAAEAAGEEERDTFRWLSDLYRKSDKFKALAARTRKEYDYYHLKVCNTRMQSGDLLGDKPLTWWDRVKIQRYLLKRARDNAPVAGNREVKYIRSAWRWGHNYGKVPLRLDNPTTGIDYNKETPRDRLVTIEEYALVYNLALTRRVWYIPPAMEIAYLCRAREVEVLSINIRTDILSDGLMIRRRKQSKTNITRWSPRLRAAVNVGLHRQGLTLTEANQLKPIDVPRKQPHIGSHYLFPRSDGQPVSTDTFKSAWQRLIHVALKHPATPLENRFTFEDLKPMGISHTAGTAYDKMRGSGHKTLAMVTRVYDREIAIVDPVGWPKPP